jgi:hypothetical protein
MSTTDAPVPRIQADTLPPHQCCLDSRTASAGNAENGRSINLALSRRGIEALRRVGVLDAVLAEAVPMKGRFIHEKNGHGSSGNSYTQLYGSFNQVLSGTLKGSARTYDSVGDLLN